MSAIRFTVQLTTAPSRDAWIEQCRRAEALGYDGVSISDHFNAQFGPLAAMSAAAMVTERVRLGFNVLAADFRHPVALAKELATIDVLSSGRLIAGLGAGWMTADYTTAGLTMDPAGVRIDRLVEYVAVLRGLWADGEYSYAGRHYAIERLDGMPKPAQRPGPPVLIGGGARRMLRTAGALADVVGIAHDNRAGVVGAQAWGSGTVAALRDKLGWIAEGARDRPAPPRVSVRVLGVAVTREAARAYAELEASTGLRASELAESPHVLVGTVDQIVATLDARRRDFGLCEYVFSQSALDDMGPVMRALGEG